MALSDRLWEFHDGLGRGEIDWNFFNSGKPSVDEKKKAMGWVVERGFVRLFRKGSFPQFNDLPSPYFVVTRAGGRISFLVIDGKAAFFTKEKYALGYALYLNREYFEGFNEHAVKRISESGGPWGIGIYRGFDFEDEAEDEGLEDEGAPF